MPTTPRIQEKSRKIKKSATEERQGETSRAKGSYTSNAKRGLGPEGGGWNIAQAAHWSGFSEAYLRDLFKRFAAGQIADIFPHYHCGRRYLIPREGFKNWFNRNVEGTNG